MQRAGYALCAQMELEGNRLVCNPAGRCRMGRDLGREARMTIETQEEVFDLIDDLIAALPWLAGVGIVFVVSAYLMYA
jgi:hypothetical protein